MAHVLEVGRSPQKNIYTSCGAGRVAAPKGSFFNGLPQSLPPLVSVYLTKAPHKANSSLEDIGKRAGAGVHGQTRKASGGAASSLLSVQLADLAKIGQIGKFTRPVWLIFAGCSWVFDFVSKYGKGAYYDGTYMFSVQCSNDNVKRRFAQCVMMAKNPLTRIYVDGGKN